MADFATFGRAVAIALGHSPTDFDLAYRENIRQLNQHVVEDCPTTRLIKEFASSHPADSPWEGNLTSLYQELLRLAKANSQYSMTDFPRSPGRLSTRLSEVMPVLADEGIVVQQLPRTNSCRPWRIFMARQPYAFDLQQIRARCEGVESHE